AAAGQGRARPRRSWPRAPGPTSPTPARGGRGTFSCCRIRSTGIWSPLPPTEPRLALIEVDSGSFLTVVVVAALAAFLAGIVSKRVPMPVVVLEIVLG